MRNNICGRALVDRAGAIFAPGQLQLLVLQRDLEALKGAVLPSQNKIDALIRIAQALTELNTPDSIQEVLNLAAYDFSEYEEDEFEDLTHSYAHFSIEIENLLGIIGQKLIDQGDLEQATTIAYRVKENAYREGRSFSLAHSFFIDLIDAHIAAEQLDRAIELNQKLPILYKDYWLHVIFSVAIKRKGYFKAIEVMNLIQDEETKARCFDQLAKAVYLSPRFD
jgi:hypothetical protein